MDCVSTGSLVESKGGHWAGRNRDLSRSSRHPAGYERLSTRMAAPRAGDERAPVGAALESTHGRAVDAAVMLFRLQAQSLAVGRLGPIYRALETAT